MNFSSAIPMVQEAGKILLYYHAKGFSFDYKGPRDLVTEADIAVEKFLKEQLFKLAPAIPFLGEETGELKQYDTCFVLDPLDGTTNFAHGFPIFCISLAYIENNEIQWGVVLEPLRNELFSAQKGKGAFLNNNRITVSKAAVLKESLLATGFPYSDEVLIRAMNYFNHITPHCQGIRRAGAAAIDLCYIACGRLDGFFELSLKPWDVSAGILLVREAGGTVTDMKGSPSSPYDTGIIASNSRIHAELLAQVQRADNHYPSFEKHFRSELLGNH